MTIVEKTEELNNNIDAIMDVVSKELGTFDFIRKLKPNELVLIQKSIEAFDQAKELLMEYAKGIEEIHRQNDEILSILKERRIESN